MFIFCGGMPRSGSTLQFQLTASIVEGAGVGRRLPWIAPGDLHQFLLPEHENGHYDVVKSHVPAKTILTRMDNGQAKSLYTHRDLRDVAVSTMSHHNIPFDNVWESMTLSDAIGWGKTWEAIPGVLVQRYDHLTRNLQAGIDEICEHIGIDLSLTERLYIANSHSIASQRAHITNIPDGQGWHSRELLHHNHISRDNGISMWRTSLTVAQVKKIEARYGDWLAEHDYQMSGY